MVTLLFKYEPGERERETHNKDLTQTSNDLTFLFEYLVQGHCTTFTLQYFYRETMRQIRQWEKYFFNLNLAVWYIDMTCVF